MHLIVKWWSPSITCAGWVFLSLSSVAFQQKSFIFLTFSFDYFTRWYKIVEIALIDFHGSSIESDPKKQQRIELFCWMVSNGTGCTEFRDTLHEKEKEILSDYFFSPRPVNFEAFHFTCMRHVSVYFSEINFKQFPCDGIYTKKFKTTSKNWFRRFFHFLFIYPLSAFLHYGFVEKQLKLKNYMRRLLILKSHKSGGWFVTLQARDHWLYIFIYIRNACFSVLL